MNPIEYYTYMYPQLTLEPEVGISQKDEYKNIVLKGIFPDKLVFPLKTSNQEELINVETPIGNIEVLYLPDRVVFERFMICLSNKCEPFEIPKTTGAVYISGLNCWRKIYKHQSEFLLTHSLEEWDDEFVRFTSDKSNYKGIVLLISKGFYSALDNEYAGYEKEEWLRISKDIRTYHELTHAVSRKLFPDHIEAIRDEVIADSIGVFYALNRYEPKLIRKFLGIENNKYRDGGRLQNYSKDIEKDMEYANDLIDKLAEYFKHCPKLKPLDLLIDIEEKYIK